MIEFQLASVVQWIKWCNLKTENIFHISFDFHCNPEKEKQKICNN